MPAPAHAIDAVQTPLPLGLDPWNGSLGTLVITYAFEDQQSGQFLRSYTGWTPWTADQKEAVRRGLREYESVVDVRFVEVSSTTADPVIAFGRVDVDTVAETWWRIAATGADPNGQPAIKRWDAGVVFDDNVDLASSGAQWLILHEIGHAMMLKHTGDYDTTGKTTPGPYLPEAEDHRDYTVMSYVRRDGSAAALQLQLYDIAALQARWGANTREASGDDVYTFADSPGIFAIWDTGGVDRIDAGAAAGAVVIDLAQGGFSQLEGQNRISIAWGAEIEHAVGSAYSDRLQGDGRGNQLTGGGGGDTLFGGGGDDVLLGGPGIDTAVFQHAAWSPSGSYRIEKGSLLRVQDHHAGGAEGEDVIQEVELLRFSDQTLVVGEVDLATALRVAWGNVLRTDPDHASNAGKFSSLLAKAQAAVSLQGAMADLLEAAGTTTSVATLTYQFFTGRTPHGGGLDYLIAPGGPNPNNLNSPYYQSFGLENRYINFASNLGKVGQGSAWFQTNYGALTLDQALAKAYTEIFGAALSEAQRKALLGDLVPDGLGGSYSRARYFEYYGQDGAGGVGTKAAMVGWLLAEAEKAELGAYAMANAAFLMDLADGTRLGVNLLAGPESPLF
ncbi:M10 family metallopeptidase [Phenylobacterium sp.]|jgi:serralysin|uniref:M10 family metallopeptidase n=1 Tax=Phenylobacterium sp. TaxID=1871053 RepID=UPI002F931672